MYFQIVNGVFMPHPVYLEKVYATARDHGALVIADETQSGLGRTGEGMWSFESHGVVPDIVTIGRPLGNGKQTYKPCYDMLNRFYFMQAILSEPWSQRHRSRRSWAPTSPRSVATRYPAPSASPSSTSFTTRSSSPPAWTLAKSSKSKWLLWKWVLRDFYWRDPICNTAPLGGLSLCCLVFI